MDFNHAEIWAGRTHDNVGLQSIARGPCGFPRLGRVEMSISGVGMIFFSSITSVDWSSGEQDY